MTKLQKTLSREMPLVMIDSFLKGYFSTGRVLDLKMPQIFSLFNRGTWISYRDNYTLHVVFPEKLSRRCGKRKNEKRLYNLCKITAEIVDFYQNIQKELAKNKDISLAELLSHLTEIQKLFVKGFPGLFIATWLPFWQENFQRNKDICLFNKRIVKNIETLREGPVDKFFNIAMDLAFLILKKIASKKRWPFYLMKYLTHRELKKFILEELPIKLLEERKDEEFGYTDNKIIHKTKLKEELRKLNIILEEEKVKEVKEFKGMVATSGKTVKGMVKIMFSREQLNKIKKGDILVAPMTTPWYLPAIKKVKAIITDEGGITCHAAIVSRELKIPCIIGTKIATKVLKDGDLVEVDADKGIVRILKKNL